MCKVWKVFARKHFVVPVKRTNKSNRQISPVYYPVKIPMSNYQSAKCNMYKRISDNIKILKPVWCCDFSLVLWPYIYRNYTISSDFEARRHRIRHMLKKRFYTQTKKSALRHCKLHAWWNCNRKPMYMKSFLVKFTLHVVGWSFKYDR